MHCSSARSATEELASNRLRLLLILGISILLSPSPVAVIVNARRRPTRSARRLRAARSRSAHRRAGRHADRRAYPTGRRARRSLPQQVVVSPAAPAAAFGPGNIVHGGCRRHAEQHRGPVRHHGRGHRTVEQPGRPECTDARAEAADSGRRNGAARVAGRPAGRPLGQPGLARIGGTNTYTAQQGDTLGRTSAALRYDGPGAGPLNNLVQPGRHQRRQKLIVPSPGSGSAVLSSRPDRARPT